MTLERVYLIRHGQTDWNATGRWQGHALAVPLNDTGQQQARELAAFLQDRPLSAIYSSDLLRAWQTAVILGGARGMEPIVDVRLRELHNGRFQGMTHEEIQAQHPEALAEFRADMMGYRIEYGETRYELQDRAYAAWRDITANAPGPAVALVAHGGTIKVLLLKLFADHPEIQSMHIPNTSVTTIDRTADGWQLGEVGVTPHLTDAAVDRDEH